MPQYAFFFRLPRFFQPADKRVVVVRAYVRNAVFRVVFRQITAVILAESELQHVHAGKTQFVPEASDPVGNDSQVFGYDFSAAVFFQQVEQFFAESRAPGAMRGCGFAVRHRQKDSYPLKWSTRSTSHRSAAVLNLSSIHE